MVPREMKGRGEADDGVDGYRSKKRGREGGNGDGSFLEQRQRMDLTQRKGEEWMEIMALIVPFL